MRPFYSSVSPPEKTQILVAEDDAALRNFLCRKLGSEGFDPIGAKDGIEAVALYREKQPLIVLSDMLMPRMNGLELLAELNKESIRPIFIFMTGHGDEDKLLKALRAGATNYFKKPLDMNELLLFIRSVTLYDTGVNISRLYTPTIVSEQKKYVFRTSERDVSAAIAQIVMNLPLIVKEQEIMNLRIGIQEMIMNAVEHGHLQIGYDEKNKRISDGTYRGMFESRLNDKRNAAKIIRVSSHISKLDFQVTIEDEGDGFDWSSIPDPTSHALYRFNGRGVFMTKIYYDDVIYNEKGNVVSLRKKRSR